MNANEPPTPEFTTVRRSIPWTPFAGALIGLAAALFLYDTSILTGDSEVWQSVAGDAGSGLAGFRFFVGEPWSWPPFRIQSLGSGTLVTITDSIPALAIIAKLARPLGISVEAWWGSWYALSLMLQGAAAVIAVRAFAVRSYALEIAAAVLAVFSPILLLRAAMHPTLMGQFVILLAFAVVGGLRHSAHPTRVAWAGILLILLCPLIHPYFLPMVAIIVIAGVAGEVVKGRFARRWMVGWSLATVASLTALALATGIFQRGLVPDKQGFTLHTALPLWPLIPQRSGLWPGESLVSHPYSFEGFNYLGAGVLLLAIVGFTRARRFVPQWLAHYQLVFLALFAFQLYAVSPVVALRDTTVWDLRHVPVVPFLGAAAAAAVLSVLRFAGMLRNLSSRGRRILWPGAMAFGGLFAATLVHEPIAWTSRRIALATALILGAVVIAACVQQVIALRGWRASGYVLSAVLATLGLAVGATPKVIDGVTSSLRASGRLAWALWYAVLVGAVVAASRTTRRAWVGALAVGCCALQIVDTSPLHSWADDNVIPTSDRVHYVQQLRDVIQVHSRVHLVPPLSCTLSSGAGFEGFRDVIIAASINLVPVDQQYAARSVAAPCADDYSIDPNTQVVTIAAAPITRDQLGAAPVGFSCGPLGALIICSAHDEALTAAGLAPVP